MATNPLEQAMALNMAADVANTPAEQPHPVRGVGGGAADAIAASIDGEPAALSEGEFVIPADVVSHLGDGSSDAGARVFQDIINEVRSKIESGAK